VIGKRYRLMRILGSGAMGSVYLALDRLSHQQVAVKLVTTAGDSDQRSVHPLLTDSGTERLALTREFRLLASLRHPNIISVLDYGFDREQQPYFVMELLETPRTILEAAHDRPFGERIALIVQGLHALAYLHRRSVIHRDLKPSNVLVDGGRVKLLDFGIAEIRKRAVSSANHGVAGTLAYLAPELLAAEPATEASDLYAFGMMCYEVFSGRHPYAGSSLPVMMQQIVREVPRLSTEDFDPRLIPILGRLLAKDPRQRYGAADEVLRDLARAFDLAIVEEGAQRDSFLQAAQLVGRRAELQELVEHLDQAMIGRGGLSLIAGESGVGKSRLLDELRSLSLVKGALVVTGQGVLTGRSPYHIWREPLRWLCLVAAPTDEEAAILRPVVPDIAELLERPVAEPALLDPLAAQKRLQATIENQLKRLRQPITIILEDLHWAGTESVALLIAMADACKSLPVALFASYRDDERPELTEILQRFARVKLDRLTTAGIAELTVSMLGPAGRHPALLDFLERETEGNVFFLVEVVRALAEEAGTLSEIDGANLPEHISTGGIQRIVLRRLQRLPRPARPLLQLAALHGRRVDPNLLKQLEPTLDVPFWLRACAEVAVIEPEGERWRFSHDRLREALLNDISGTEKRALHRRLAVALEDRSGGGAAERVAALAHHWREAAEVGDPLATAKAVTYLERVGRLALDSCSAAEAEGHLLEALRLQATLPTEDLHQEIRLQLALGGAYLMSKGHAAPAVGLAFGRARTLCLRSGEQELLLPVLFGLWRHHVVRGELIKARALADQLLEVSAEREDPVLDLLGRYALGTNLLFQGDAQGGADCLGRTVEIWDHMAPLDRHEVTRHSLALGQHAVVAALGYGSWALWMLGELEAAQRGVDRCLSLADQLEHPFSQAYARSLAAWVEQVRHDPAATIAKAQISAAISKEGGFAYFLAISTLLDGWAKALGGDGRGIVQVQRVVEGLRALGAELFRPYFLSQLAEALGACGRAEEGRDVLAEALELAERTGETWWEAEIYRLRGVLELKLPGHTSENAEANLLKALHRARLRRERSLELRAVLDLEELWRNAEPLRRHKARATLVKLVNGFAAEARSTDLDRARAALAAPG
jgi:predicted ATPase